METVTSTLSEKFSRLFQTSREYLENKVELQVLKGADKMAKGLSLFSVILIAAAFSLIVVILLCIGFAIMINDAMESTYAGYLIMSGVVLVLMVLIMTLGRKAIRQKVINMILKNIDND